MANVKQMHVRADALRALTKWKSMFGEQVLALASQVASDAGQTSAISIEQFRQAAKNALDILSTAIDEDAGLTDDSQKAA